MPEGERYLRNIPLVFTLNAIWMFMVLMPVIVPFFQSRGLDMAGIYTLQAAFGATLLLLEVPSGYVSDLFGRKRTLFLSSLCHGLGFTLFVFAEGFYSLLVAELVLAVAVSLYSGTDISLIYDSLSAAGSKKAPIKLMGLKVFYGQVGETLGGLVGGWLVLASLEAPVIAQAVVAWLPALVVLGLREPPRPLMDKTKHRENAAYIWRSLFRKSPLLTLVILNMVSWGSATLIAVWAFQKYWQSLGIALAWFGYLWAVSNLTVAVVARYAHKIEKALGSAVAVALMALLPVAGYLGMAWTDAVWGALFCVVFQASRGLNAVIMRDALNRRVSSDMRATANSVMSLGVRIVFLVAGPLTGLLIDRRGTGYAFAWLGAAFALAFVLLTIPLLRQRAQYDPLPK
ncbi:MFS transporter [Elusimicrobiota bacterium]